MTADQTSSALARLLGDPTALARVLNDRATSELVGVSPRTWDRMRAAGDVPPLTRLSKYRVGYRLLDILAWLDGRRVRPEDDHERYLRSPRGRANAA
jgi:predicted DNA-binding transcriptional regulator AlpA